MEDPTAEHFRGRIPGLKHGVFDVALFYGGTRQSTAQLDGHVLLICWDRLGVAKEDLLRRVGKFFEICVIARA